MASIIAADMTKASKTKASPHTPAQGFSYSREQFESLVDAALKHAKKLGATDAGADASEGCGLSVSVRKGELENVERNRDKSLGVTVYMGHRRGNASTSDFSQAAIERTVQAAYDIARFTAEDPVAGLPEEKDIASHHPDLDMFHPWPITSADAATIALRCEAAAMQTDKRITNSEGAAVSAQQSHFFSAHTPRFSGWLRQLAPQHFGCPHRGQGRWHATRRLVQLDAQRGRAVFPRIDWPLRCRARPESFEIPQDRHD